MRATRTALKGFTACTWADSKSLAYLCLQMLQLLADNPYIVMDEHFEGNEDRTEEPEAGVDVKVWGNVVAFVERLDDEHFKSLQVSKAASKPSFPDPTSLLGFWVKWSSRSGATWWRLWSV